MTEAMLRETRRKQALYLVVQHHYVMAVGVQPSVHGLADAADFVQGRGMVVRPAKVKHLWTHGGKQSDGTGVRERDTTETESLWNPALTLGFSWVMS